MTIFKCDICSKTFLASRDLRRHILTHTGEKPIKCELCDKRFARPDNMKLHVRRIHSDDLDGGRPAMTVGSVGAQQNPSAAPKRSRLSLNKKSGGKKSADLNSTPKKEETPTKLEQVEETKLEKVEHVEIPDYVNEPRPAIASFGNLGNTCFLNSVLQVLRYTPGFVPNVSYLSKELLSAHREKLAGNENDDDDVEVSSQWRLVRSLSKLFIKMNKAEESFDEDSDPYDLVMHPSKLLDIVREMNPMFEGNLQHDAQEMLRCLLCYIQDATNELTKFRTEPQEGVVRSPEKLKDSFATDGGVKTSDLNDVVDLSEEVDMSKDCNFNYDLKHLTPAKAEVQMRGGARPKAKSSATVRKRKGKVVSELEKSDVCENNADGVKHSVDNGGDRLKNGVENGAGRLENPSGVENGADRLENGVVNGGDRLENGVENGEVVSQVNGKRAKNSKSGKDSEPVKAEKVTNGTAGRRKRATKKDSLTVSPIKGRSGTSKSAPKDADVESRPVDEKVLENLGEQSEVSVSVDDEGSITLSPRKDTAVLLSPSKNGTVRMSVKQTTALPDNSNTSSQCCILNGNAEDNEKILVAQKDVKTSRGKKTNKKSHSNIFESFVVEKTASLKYNYVPTVKRVNGIGSGDSKIEPESDEALGLKWSVNKTTKTYSKKSTNAEQTSKSVPVVSPDGCGDAEIKEKNNDLDWLKPVKRSPPEMSSFADAFSNFLKQGSNLKSKSTSPKKQLPSEAVSPVKSEECLSPLTCQIPLTTSVMCPNGVSPKLPASLSPTVALSQLENKEINNATKKNLSAKFAGCSDDRISNQDENLPSVFCDVELNSETDLGLDTNNPQSSVEGPDTMEHSSRSDVINSPVKPANGFDAKLPEHLSPEVDLHLADDQIGSVSPKESPADSASGPVASPIPKLQVINKQTPSPSVIVCQVHSPEKQLGGENGMSGAGSPMCTAMDTSSPKHLEESLSTPDKNATSGLDLVTDMQSSIVGKNTSGASDDLHSSEGQGSSSKIQHPRSNKRVLFETCDEIVTESAPKRQRHGAERGQTNLFAHFGKKRTVRRLGMRGGVVVKDEMESESPVSPPILSLNGHSLGAPISNVASGLLDEEFDLRDASGSVTFDNVDYSYRYISPMKQPVIPDKSPNLTPIKRSFEEDCNIYKVRKSLDFNSSSLTPEAEDANGQKPGDKDEIEPMETILMADLVKDAMSQSRKAVVCLEKCDSVQKKTGKRLIDSDYDEQRVKVVENMFQGMVVLKTRCLECECCTARKEDFQDVSIPVPSRKSTAITEGEPGDVDAAGDGADADVPSDDEDFPDVTTSDWMLSAMAEVEQLRDENKYYCDQCCRLVEAQRFMQYEMMPDILTFHVKRFAACMSILGGVSKLTDHTATPFSLPCFKATCPKPCQVSSHSYNLYGIIMHSGLTITAGHYTAYVKVPSDLATMNKKPKDRHVPDMYESPGVVRLDELTNQWLECDDDVIKPLSEEELQSSLGELDTCATPYVLFYRRNN